MEYICTQLNIIFQYLEIRIKSFSKFSFDTEMDKHQPRPNVDDPNNVRFLIFIGQLMW